MPTLTRTRLSSLTVLLVVAAGLLACSAGLLVAVLPALVLAVLLVLGFFPGEELIERLAGRSPRVRRRTCSQAPPPGHTQWRPSSLLLADGLASRPPPLTA